MRFEPTLGPILFALVAVAGFSTLAALGYRSLAIGSGPRRELAWVAVLIAAGVPTQALLQEGAPIGYGLAKWIYALDSPGSSGYHTIAKQRMSDPRRFLAEYPGWIARQDALHVGTHPPGLFLIARGLLDLAEDHPELARSVVAWSPRHRLDRDGDHPVAARFHPGRRRVLTLTGALTLLACAATVGPTYLLARASFPAPVAWSAAALWPLAPSAILFQPTADTAFPLLSTLALALAARAQRSTGRGWGFAIGSGLVLAVGMTFSLAYLAVGLVVAVVLILPPGPIGRRVGRIAAVGVGFLAATLAWWAATSANPFAIWWANQRNHARFYHRISPELRRVGAWRIRSSWPSAWGCRSRCWRRYRIPRSPRH